MVLFFILLDLFIFRRIKKLSKAVNKIHNGEYDNQIKSKGHDEISDLLRDFNEMSQQLNSNEYLSREFVRNVSHEFKTPLSSIIGYADLLKSSGKNLTNEQKQYLDIISNQADQLENMSRQMLLISRLDADVSLMPCTEFSPAKQIQAIIISMQNIWENKHLDWDLQLSQQNISSRAELTYSIWQNLISNAIKFANDNSIIKINLVISEQIVFTIKNNGPEISDLEKTLIFKQFYTNKTKHNQHGSGLGLALVHKIIQKLAGDVEILSDKQQTVFKVTLPNSKS